MHREMLFHEQSLPLNPALIAARKFLKESKGTVRKYKEKSDLAKKEADRK